MNSPARQLARNKLVLRLIALGIILAAAWLQPPLQKWLGSTAQDDAAVVQRDAAADPYTGSPSLLAEHDNAEGDVAPGDIAAQRPQLRPRNTANTAASSTAASAPPIASDKDESPAPTESNAPRPGTLKLVGRNVFRSTAGLMYRPGSQDGHRLKHILKHAEDDPSKPVHGVFDGDRDQILEWIDVAWTEAQEGGKNVRKQQERDRTAWTIKMDGRIGYVGGQNGKRKNYPECRFLRLVLEHETIVITAYPVSSF